MERVWNLIDSKTICWGGEWDDSKSTIRSTVFGVMIELARDRVKHYISDLYHDATWLAESLTGPMQFEWVARESGTFIGESANYHNVDEWVGAIKYRFEILVNDKNKWVLNLYEAGPLVSVPNVPDTIPTDIDYSENEAYQLEAEKVERFCNEDPLPENVVQALVNTDVNPINWTPEKVEEIVTKYDAEQISVVGDSETFSPFDYVTHDKLPIGQCVLATTAVGCIYHPAPPISTFHSYTDEEKIAIAEATFPTLRNNSNLDSTQTRKVRFNMDSILEELRNKLDEANSARDEAYDAKNELDDAISEFDDYIDQVESLISNLDDMPSLSVDLDVRVSFES